MDDKKKFVPRTKFDLPWQEGCVDVRVDPEFEEAELSDIPATNEYSEPQHVWFFHGEHCKGPMIFKRISSGQCVLVCLVGCGHRTVLNMPLADPFFANPSLAALAAALEVARTQR